MGLSGFRQNNDYIKIDALNFDKISNQIAVRLGYYSERGGALLMPIDLDISRQSAVEACISAVVETLNEPEYPSLCSEREALVPMWTEASTDDEKEAYEAAKATYLSEVETYNTAVEAIKTTAETENDYDTYFTDTAMYSDGNIEKCIYTWAKTLDVFSGVTDVLEEE